MAKAVQVIEKCPKDEPHLICYNNFSRKTTKLLLCINRERFKGERCVKAESCFDCILLCTQMLMSVRMMCATPTPSVPTLKDPMFAAAV